MKLNIDVMTDGYCKDCKVTIKDTSKYLAEDFKEVVKGEFKYSDTMSIDVLQHNKSKETVYGNAIYSLHDSTPITMPVEFDGWFTVIHTVLPTKKWFDEDLKKEVSAAALYDVVYYSDGNNIYKHSKAKSDEQVTVEEVLEVNPVNTTISRTLKDYVSICFLKKCYINICNLIFDDRGFSSCWNKSKVDSELVYKRDLVWMALNVIKYLTECEQLAEVERIIENITSCNGLCSTTTSNKAQGCGCSG